MVGDCLLITFQVAESTLFVHRVRGVMIVVIQGFVPLLAFFCPFRQDFPERGFPVRRVARICVQKPRWGAVVKCCFPLWPPC